MCDHIVYSCGLTLKDRVTYLARSVMCMRSDKIGYAPQYGVFLRELEDKVEIAKVQEQILNAIINLRNGHPNREEAIVALNTNLFDITQVCGGIIFLSPMPGNEANKSANTSKILYQKFSGFSVITCFVFSCLIYI